MSLVVAMFVVSVEASAGVLSKEWLQGMHESAWPQLVAQHLDEPHLVETVIVRQAPKSLQVRLQIGQDGRAMSVLLDGSSGAPELDAVALSTARQVAFPVPPGGQDEDGTAFLTVPVQIAWHQTAHPKRLGRRINRIRRQLDSCRVRHSQRPGTTVAVTWRVEAGEILESSTTLWLQQRPATIDILAEPAYTVCAVRVVAEAHLPVFVDGRVEWRFNVGGSSG